MFVRSELKARAKEVLHGKYWKLFAAALVLMLLGNGVPEFVIKFNYNVDLPASQWMDAASVTVLGNSLYTVRDVIGWFGPIIMLFAFVSVVAGILLNIFVFTPLSFGLTNYFKRASLDSESMDSVFSCFTDWETLKRVAVTGFLQNLWIFLYTLLLVVPGLIKSYSYRFVPFLTEDEPDLSPREILELSQSMTKGIKWDLFVLDLSFFLWYLLDVVTFDIAGYFIRPYVCQTNAECYLEVRKQYYGG